MNVIKEELKNAGRYEDVINYLHKRVDTLDKNIKRSRRVFISRFEDTILLKDISIRDNASKMLLFLQSDNVEYSKNEYGVLSSDINATSFCNKLNIGSIIIDKSKSISDLSDEIESARIVEIIKIILSLQNVEDFKLPDYLRKEEEVV